MEIAAGACDHDVASSTGTDRTTLSSSSEVARTSDGPRILFIGKLYAGHRTRFLNLRAHTEHDTRIRPLYREVSGRVEHGIIERIPLLSRSSTGRIRSAQEGVAALGGPRPDVIWTSAGEIVAPALLTRPRRLRTPLVLDLDWTLEQQEAFAPHYFNRAPKSGVHWHVARLQERLLWHHVSVFTPWSTWAANSLRRQGIPDSRIQVLSPGIDLDRWQPPAGRLTSVGPLRLLFVGGDFKRKGGDILLTAMRSALRGRCELDIVTHDPVEPCPGVRVHRAEPNSDLLRRLYAEANIFVMPTRAECFGIATIEAMACGLPVIVGDVGGVRDIIDHGETGWLIPPDGRALVQTIEHALAHREMLSQIGAQGRRVAEMRFDGRRNDARIVDILLDAARDRRWRPESA
jgi:glycosyltransferase involved in cell wall biosynthesis